MTRPAHRCWRCRRKIDMDCCWPVWFADKPRELCGACNRVAMEAYREMWSKLKRPPRREERKG